MHADDIRPLPNAPHEPGEHASRPELDEEVVPLLQEPFHGL